MRKGDRAMGVWGLIVILIVVVNAFCWAAGSEEAGAYKVGAYSEHDGSNVTNEVTQVCTVTLITGDVVIVTTLPDGKRGFAIKSADPTKLGQSFQIFKIPKGTYIFPEQIDLSKVDKELFNIDYLIREEYCNLTYLPVLVDYKDKEEKVFGVAEQKELEKDVNITIVKSYRAIPTFSAKLSFEGINETFKTLVERPEIKKIWLDKKVKASLYDSVPLIGAPELWERGYKGSGLKIAILDTGIDDTHPDLDDLDDDPVTFDPKVIVKNDFTDDETTEDLYGHGTHCAGIAAGTGAASSAPYPTPTPVPTPTHTPAPPPSSGLSVPLYTGENLEQKVKREVYSSEETTPDAYEPDDNYWLANWIPTDGTKQLHDFHVPGDLDYVKFNATENTKYLIETSELGYESDTYMYLYDTDGLTEITHDDDNGEGLASRVIWKCG
jgi:subtilisin family serine protease